MQPAEDEPQALRMLSRDPRCCPSKEEPLQALVLEALDHVPNVTRDVTRVQGERLHVERGCAFAW